jgi:hypothetical protein
MNVLFDKQFVFIIGAPRSGTTWLQAMLGAHPSICTLTELKLYNDFTAPWIHAWKTQASQHQYGNLTGLPTLWTEEEFYTYLREFLDRVYSHILEAKPDASVVLDKTPGYAFFIEDIERLVPKAKYIHIIRDGRDVATSMLAASQGWAKAWAPHEVKSAAAGWKKYVMAAQKARRLGERYLEVRYENILADGPQVLGTLFEFVGVPCDREQLLAISDDHTFEQMKQGKTESNKIYQAEGFFRKGQSGDWKNGLTASQQFIFHDVAGELLCELGYANEAWWIGNRYQRLTLPLLDKSWRRKIFTRGLKQIPGLGKIKELVQRIV